MKVCIIIPTYNEKENIEKLIEKISEKLPSASIIVSDDNSPDGTGVIAERLGKKFNVRVIHRMENRGYGNSIMDGMKLALKLKANKIITMDSDFSHNPEVLQKIIKELDNFDVVIGSRRVNGGKIIGWNMWRHFCSFGAGTFSRIMLGLKTRDITSGYRGYNGEASNFLISKNISSNGYSFLEEILYYLEKKGFKIKEVPITFVDRKFGKSKLSKKEIIKFFKTIIGLKLRK